MFALDVKQLCVSLGDPELPKQTSNEHHALEDARWTKQAWTWLDQGMPMTPTRRAEEIGVEAKGE
jgi:hypothetical protein